MKVKNPDNEGEIKMFNDVNINVDLKIVDEIYTDLVKPSAISAGKIMEVIPNVINGALADIKIWGVKREYKLQEVIKEIELKMKKVNPEDIVVPENYVLIPALEAISYSMDNDILRDMYANLLAKAIYSPTKDLVHPSYVEVIKQLHPVEAQFFKEYFFNDKPIFIAKLGIQEVKTARIMGSPDTYEIVDEIVADIECFYLEDYGLERVLQNLERLGLIEINFALELISGGDFDFTKKFEEDINGDYFKIKKEMEMKGMNVRSRNLHGYMKIKSYGLSFYKTCIRDIEGIIEDV